MEKESDSLSKGNLRWSWLLQSRKYKTVLNLQVNIVKVSAVALPQINEQIVFLKKIQSWLDTSLTR